MTQIVKYYQKMVAFLVAIKKYISGCFHQILDVCLNYLITWLCRHYQPDAIYF